MLTGRPYNDLFSASHNWDEFSAFVIAQVDIHRVVLDVQYNNITKENVIVKVHNYDKRIAVIPHGTKFGEHGFVHFSAPKELLYLLGKGRIHIEQMLKELLYRTVR